MVVPINGIRKSHLVLWFLAALAIFVIVNERNGNVNFIPDSEEVSSKDGIKRISFKMQHCDCHRLVSQICHKKQKCAKKYLPNVSFSTSIF